VFVVITTPRRERRPHRFSIDLPPDAGEALMRAAMREFRDQPSQAVVLIIDGLRRAGDLPDTVPAEPSR
jgi:hypothetical protein